MLFQSNVVSRLSLHWVYRASADSLAAIHSAHPQQMQKRTTRKPKKIAVRIVLVKLTGESGMVISGADESSKDAGKNPLGVNSFLWRATLDTLAFMPLASADPFGGVILTDWYEDPKTRGERFKVNALILDRQLRADSIRITSFKQVKNAKGEWVDAPIDSSVARKMEDAVLTRARELRVSQLGY